MAGEFYVDRTSLTADELQRVGEVEWRGRGGAKRTLTLAAVRDTHDRLLVRVHADFRLEVHIDTDEGNACALQSDTPVELLK